MKKKLSLIIKKPNFLIKIKIIKNKNILLITNKEKIIKLKFNSNKLLQKKKINFFLKQIKNSFLSIEYGWFSEISLKGIGYKSFYIKKKLILDLGYSNLITYTIPENLFVWNLKTKLYFFSLNKSYLNNIIYQIRKFSIPGVYTGKGILINKEFIKLKSKSVR